MNTLKSAAASIVKSYHSEKSDRDVLYISVIEGQYPWALYSQECLRIVVALKTLGPQGFPAVVGGHATGTVYQTTELFEYAEYQGHSLLRLKADKSDSRGLQFGPGKAKALMALYSQAGHSAFLDACVTVAGDAKLSSGKPARKGGKAKGKGQSKSSGKPARKGGSPRSEAMAEIMEMATELKVPHNPAPATVPAPAKPATVAQTPAEIEAEILRHFQAITDLQAKLRAMQATV
jgi:hypothetical protein